MLHVAGGWLLVLLLQVVDTMDLCEYFARLGVDKPECRKQIHFDTFDPNPRPALHSMAQVLHFHQLLPSPVIVDSPKLPVQKFELVGSPGFDYPLCKNYYHSCMFSTKCESGTVCTTGFDTTPCCTSTVTRCPSVASLGINCRKPKSVNWCFTDRDCRGAATTSSSMCCPTGSFSRLNLNQDQCPDPWKIDVKCNVRRPTSWCAKHSDCPTVNSVNPRRCCQTLCGYTACMVRYNNKWMIA
ncbi:unnamed protein product, partial [Mesorhabditis spiculigera]